MAKNIGRLAGLAALAGAAYMMSKGKDKDKEGPAATAGEEKASKARIAAQKDAVSGSRATNESGSRATNESAYTGTTKNTADAAKSIGFGGGDDSDKNLKRVEPKSAAVTPSAVETKSLNPVSEPSDKSIKLAPEKSNLEAGMSRGTRTPAKPVSTVSSSEEGMKNYKPRRTPAAPSTAKSTVSSSAEGMKNYKPRSTQPSATKSTPPVAAKPTTSPASNSRVPTSEQAAANRQAVYDKVKSVGSSVGDYVKNFETPAERRARERKESSGMKRGGAVKKMASGGMTASRRADGIASRGKTRCKMY